jgi:hypothetical protein
VVVAFNGLNLLVLFVSVLIGVFFLFKQGNRVGKYYPIFFQKVVQVDKNYSSCVPESNFDTIRVKTHGCFFRIDPLYVF